MSRTLNLLGPGIYRTGALFSHRPSKSSRLQAHHLCPWPTLHRRRNALTELIAQRSHRIVGTVHPAAGCTRAERFGGRQALELIVPRSQVKEVAQLKRPIQPL